MKVCRAFFLSCRTNHRDSYPVTIRPPMYIFSLAGSFAACSFAADRQTKQNVHPDIESDYERRSNRNKKENALPIGLNIIILLF